MYHTNKRPRDKNGNTLKPLDLVILGDIPEHYWVDPGFSSLKKYKGCYGLITYEDRDGIVYNPYYLGDKNHPGWVNSEGSVVNVLTRRIDMDNEAVASWQFWLPPETLQKIPYNALIMNIFAEYPWQMKEENGPSDYLFIRKGVEEYQYIKKIMETPYKKLVAAHDAAMNILDSKMWHTIDMEQSNHSPSRMMFATSSRIFALSSR